MWFRQAHPIIKLSRNDIAILGNALLHEKARFYFEETHAKRNDNRRAVAEWRARANDAQRLFDELQRIASYRGNVTIEGKCD